MSEFLAESCADLTIQHDQYGVLFTLAQPPPFHVPTKINLSEPLAELCRFCVLQVRNGRSERAEESQEAISLHWQLLIGGRLFS